jgi:hypothetical protein
MSSTRGIHDLEKEPSNLVDSPGNLEKGTRTERLPLDPTDWNGPDDLLNPLNWPTWKRYFHVIPPALISFSWYAYLQFQSSLLNLYFASHDASLTGSLAHRF